MQDNSECGKSTASSALRACEAHGAGRGTLSALPTRDSHVLGEDTHTSRAALTQLREEVKGLSSRVTQLEESGKPRQDAAQLEESLATPVARLEEECTALRAACKVRFETLETQLDSLDATQASLAQLIHTVPRGAGDEGTRGTRGSKSPRREEVPSLRQSRHTDEPKRRSFASSSNAIPITARTRSKSPDSRSSKRSRHDAGPPSASTSVTRVEGASPYFAVPDWASQVTLQSWPLRAGRDFISILHAFELATQRVQRPLENADVASALRDIDPGIFERHNCERWKDLLHLAQRYLSLHLDLPRMQRDVRRLRGELLVILDPRRPWYAKPVNPPKYSLQVDAICRRAGISPRLWRDRRAALRPLSRTPEPPPHLRNPTLDERS